MANVSSTTVGWIGTGVMGLHMASHCLKAGVNKMHVFNRTRSKMAPLLHQGAHAADSHTTLARECDVVFTMLGFPQDVRDVILAPDTGVLQNLKEGGVIVDLTTSEPALAEDIAAQAQEQGKFCLDAPVSGGDVGAREGKLCVFVGGNRGAFERVKPIIESFAKSITYLGGPGKGQHCKMANQITIATNMIGLCEGLLYAHAAKINLEDYLQAISGGGAASFSVSAYGGRILRGDLDPGSYVEHFVKDLRIALREAERLKLSLPGLALAQQLYGSLLAHGESRLGTQALIRVLERMNNTYLSREV